MRNTNGIFEKGVRREYQYILRVCPERDEVLSAPIMEDEICTALKNMKTGKAAGVDGVYPDMLRNLGTGALRWMSLVFSEILSKGKCPREWKSAIILAILKPGKPPDLATSYRPIALLCCLYKLLERIILTRISPVVDSVVPVEQAGFRKGRDTIEQIVGLTSFIETGFEQMVKVGAVFVDLSYAYDTVWREGLLLKLARVIK